MSLVGETVDRVHEEPVATPIRDPRSNRDGRTDGEPHSDRVDDGQHRGQSTVSVPPERTESAPSSFGSRLRAGSAALGACLAGFAAGLVGILVGGPLVELLGVGGTDAYRAVSGHLIQLGFAGFGLAVLVRERDRLPRYVKLRRPTLGDLAWLALLVLLLPVLTAAWGSVLGAIGLPHGGGGGGIERWLLTRPDLWPIAFVGLYLFAAPAEELVYRGIVQGCLRPAFDRVGVVAGGALLFGLMHLLVGLLTPGYALLGALHWGLGAIAPGLLWGLAYERTGNLFVTAFAHAASWTLPLGALLPAP